MSLNISEMQAKHDGVISLSSGTEIFYPGKVCQTIFKRSDLRTTYSAPNSGNGTRIEELDTTIIPKFNNSWLLINFYINGEIHHDSVFTIFRNGSLITDSGYQGFNADVGNSRWSGIASGFYDRNQDSTPSSWFLQYLVPAYDTESRYYSPAIRSSSSANYTLAFNRTLGSAGQNSYEALVSSCVIMELTR